MLRKRELSTATPNTLLLGVASKGKTAATAAIRLANGESEKVADLEAQIAMLQIDVADWKAIAEEREKIAAIAVQRYKEASDQLNAAKANNESEATNAKTV